MSDLALHFLNKMKIMVVKDIEREDIEFICKVTVAVFRAAHFRSFRPVLGCLFVKHNTVHTQADYLLSLYIQTIQTLIGDMKLLMLPCVSSFGCCTISKNKVFSPDHWHQTHRPYRPLHSRNVGHSGASRGGQLGRFWKVGEGMHEDVSMNHLKIMR